MIFNPHKKHGYVSGDVNSPFFVAMELAYDQYQVRLKTFSAASPFSIGSLLEARMRYEILKECTYWSHSGTDRRSHLDAAVARLGLFDDSGLTSNVEVAARELQRQVATVVVTELRQHYAK